MNIWHRLRGNYLRFLEMTSVVTFLSIASHRVCKKFMLTIFNNWLERVSKKIHIQFFSAALLLLHPSCSLKLFKCILFICDWIFFVQNCQNTDWYLIFEIIKFRKSLTKSIYLFLHSVKVFFISPTTCFSLQPLGRREYKLFKIKYR